jgi:hypothetical protein
LCDNSILVSAHFCRDFRHDIGAIPVSAALTVALAICATIAQCAPVSDQAFRNAITFAIRHSDYGSADQFFESG